MKRIIVLVTIYVGICLAVIAQAQPVIVDHTCADIDQIPQQWIETAKSNLRISYGHTSHGSQLVTGINAISGFNSAYNFTYSSGYSAGVFLNDYTYHQGISGIPTEQHGRRQQEIFSIDPVEMTVMLSCGPGVARWMARRLRSTRT